MKPEWRRLLPLPAAFLAGVLGSLLLGTGPRSIAAGEGDQEPWALPVLHAEDLAAADAIWGERHPWGRPPVTAEEAAAQAVPVAVPVGVVQDRGGLQALFSLDGALPVAVNEGGATPDGGTVTSIAPTVITWRDEGGQSKRHELFIEESPAGASPAPAPGRAQPTRPTRGVNGQQRPASNPDRQSRQRRDPPARSQ